MRNKLLTAILISSLPIGNLFATCQANFTWSQTANNVITFTDASTGTSVGTMYYWDFGDGNYSYTQNPVHTFNIPGTYNVCLMLSDSNVIGPCTSSFCANVTVTGTVICNMTLSFSYTMASCGSCADGSATVTPAGGSAPYTYSWSPISNTTATASGLLPGTYTCCVTDANSCTACDSVTITTSSCQANFTWVQTSNNVISFTNTSTGLSPSTFVMWDFGDGNYNFTTSPSHSYNMPGTYIVCLQLNDSNFLGPCSSMFCDTITVTGVNCNNIAVAINTVNATCMACNDGSATATPSGGTPPYSYLWNTSATTQTINNLSVGLYACTITDALGCTASDSGWVDSIFVCSAYFTLTPDILPHTYTAVNFATGVPPLNYTWSWGDATYSYTAYPTHTYASAGWYVICLTITDAMSCTSTYCDSFNIARMDLSNTMVTVNVVPSTVGIPQLNVSPGTIIVYPNPVKNQLFIIGNQLTDANAVEVFDLTGRKVDMSSLVRVSKMESVADVTKLSSGIYFVKVKTESGISVSRFVKE